MSDEPVCFASFALDSLAIWFKGLISARSRAKLGRQTSEARTEVVDGR